MKRCFALILVLLAGFSAGQAQSLDDQYLQIFGLIQEADSLAAAEPAQALAKYGQAKTGLQKLQKENPSWNSSVVNFRLGYVADRMKALAAKVPAAATAAPSGPATPAQAATPGATPANVQPATPAAPNDWAEQLNGLKEQVRQLQEDKGLLQAKLKEAFAAQPAQADPRELARAEEKVKTLQKENDLLKVTLDQQKSKPAPAADPKALEQSQQALTEANRQLAAQKEIISRLTQEKQSAQERLRAISTDNSKAAALASENEALKKEVAAAKATLGANVKAEDAQRQLGQAQNQIASLQSEKEALRLEKTALEERVKKLDSTTVSSRVLPPASSAQDLAQIRELEQDRDALQKKLDAADKALYGRKGKVVAGKVEELEGQLGAMRARLEVFEAQQVPYTAEELALLKAPASKLDQSPPNEGKKSVKTLPAGAAKLVAEAQGYFAAKQFDKAEAIYTQALREDPRNVPLLANLAAIQVEARHLDAAENNLRQALSVDPEDSYSLYVLGILNFRRARYDAALEALSRAAKLDSNNAEIQNYLGLTLSEKGMRGPAEAAFRKAVELQPNYASAHVNLAVFYATQNPPYAALARWHYQKALDCGHPRNPALEKMLEGK